MGKTSKPQRGCERSVRAKRSRSVSPSRLAREYAEVIRLREEVRRCEARRASPGVEESFVEE